MASNTFIILRLVENAVWFIKNATIKAMIRVFVKFFWSITYENDIENFDVRMRIA